MMNQATKSVAVLLVSLASAIPVFAYAFSAPKPVAFSTEERTGVVTVGEITVTKDAVEETVVPAPKKAPVFKAKRYPSVIDSDGNQPPCGSGFWDRKSHCKLPRI